MAILGYLIGRRMTVINRSGDVIYPFRAVVPKKGSELHVDKPSGPGDINFLGVAMPNLKYIEERTPDNEEFEIVLDGQYPMEIAADVSAGDYVQIADSDGRIKPITAEQLSGGTTAIGVVGIALESGTFSASESIKVVVQLRPGLFTAK